MSEGDEFVATQAQAFHEDVVWWQLGPLRTEDLPPTYLVESETGGLVFPKSCFGDLIKRQSSLIQVK